MKLEGHADQRCGRFPSWSITAFIAVGFLDHSTNYSVARFPTSSSTTHPRAILTSASSHNTGLIAGTTSLPSPTMVWQASQHNRALDP